MFENVEIYSKSVCPFCDKAKFYFKSKGVEYKEYNVEDPEHMKVMMERNPLARTVPQIFINNQLIGGYTDLIEKFES
ncbi:MAG: glutaredoxin domain-containing protein [Gammaproteobacteria bacterium]|jgi:glutaredoxin